MVIKALPQLVQIGLLNITNDSVKTMDAEHRLKLLHSIEQHGQLRNVLIDADYNVVEGRQIVRTMRELGYEFVEAKTHTADVAGAHLARLALDSEYSVFDFVQVSVFLNDNFDLKDKGGLFAKLPFCNDDIEDYVNSTTFSMAQFNAHTQPQQQGLF